MKYGNGDNLAVVCLIFLEAACLSVSCQISFKICLSICPFCCTVLTFSGIRNCSLTLHLSIE